MAVPSTCNPSPSLAHEPMALSQRLQPQASIRQAMPPYLPLVPFQQQVQVQHMASSHVVQALFHIQILGPKLGGLKIGAHQYQLTNQPQEQLYSSSQPSACSLPRHHSSPSHANPPLLCPELHNYCPCCCLPAAPIISGLQLVKKQLSCASCR